MGGGRKYWGASLYIPLPATPVPNGISNEDVTEFAFSPDTRHNTGHSDIARTKIVYHSGSENSSGSHAHARCDCRDYGMWVPVVYVLTPFVHRAIAGLLQVIPTPR